MVINDNSYKTMMPNYENVLSDEEIIAVLSYIKHSWPAEERAWQDKVNGNEEAVIKPLKKKSTLLENC